MITFFRTESCKGCREIQEAMQRISLAHKAVMVSKGQKAPVLEDNGERIEGHDKIIAHLRKLEEFKKEWDKFQSDACYCDEEGNAE